MSDPWTLGPWHVDWKPLQAVAIYGRGIYAEGRDRYLVDPPLAVAEAADARLIAVAPEMAELLSQAVFAVGSAMDDERTVEQRHELALWGERIREVLARARGNA